MAQVRPQPRRGSGTQHEGATVGEHYADGGAVEVAAHLVYELGANGKQLRVVKFTDYTSEKVRSMCPSAADLRSKWSNAEERAEIIQAY